MKKALVIGGNRFFGRHLSEWLSNHDFEVTIFNRGNIKDNLSANIRRIRGDRDQLADLKNAANSQNWDFVFDQVCFDANQAEAACKIFEGRVAHYVMTSTKSVYDYCENLSENDFDPRVYQFNERATYLTNYGEAKRQAEATFYQRAAFPVGTVRIPMILGNDDYTGRLDWHLKKIKSGEPFFAPNLKAEMGFLLSTDAGRLIGEYGIAKMIGPINFAAPGVIEMGKLFEIIKTATNGVINIKEDGEKSPFGVQKTWTMNLNKMDELGLKANHLMEWLPNLINERSRALFS